MNLSKTLSEFNNLNKMQFITNLPLHTFHQTHGVYKTHNQFIANNLKN